MTMISFAAQHLARLFPAHLVVGEDLAIISCGPALAGRVAVGTRLADLAGGEEPVSASRLAALAHGGAELDLILGEPVLHLCGGVVPLGAGYLLALHIVPNGGGVHPAGCTVSDFAPGDPVVQAMMLGGIQRAMLEESRETALELAQERQRTIELLGRVSRAAGHMAHEFNNLISIIGLNCDRLLRDLADRPEVQRPAALIRDTAARGSVITQSLMTLAGQQDDTSETFALDEAIEFHRAFFALILGHETELACSTGAPGARVRVSHSGLANCVANLLVNLRDAGQGRTIALATRVIAEDERDMAEIALLMHGRTLPANALRGGIEALFAGAGAHLLFTGSSVERFVRDAGGRISVETGSAESGTEGALRLRLQFPLAGAAGTFAGPSAPAQGGLVDGGGPRLLVVDDEPYALEALSDLLCDLGYAVTACDGGEQALAALRHERFDLLLTDVIMPGLSGTELAEQASRAHPDLRVVLMSGYLPEHDPHRGQHRDEWQFMRKPLDIARLEAVLRETCA